MEEVSKLTSYHSFYFLTWKWGAGGSKPPTFFGGGGCGLVKKL